MNNCTHGLNISNKDRNKKRRPRTNSNIKNKSLKIVPPKKKT